MSVRVVARIRPLLKNELEKDSIVQPATTEGASHPSLVRIPNPKNAAESYSFNFNAVYDQSSTQQDLFDSEIAPTVKHLYNGFDTTIFAYGVTGTGKTHTMRGGKTLADRGVIPRLLSAIFRRGRKVDKDTGGATSVSVAMSYYELYNDKVYDLFEPPEARTAVGLPIRDNAAGKAVVCGLSERPCRTLKEFEALYDAANVHRSTAGTRLNAHSSRSHAVLVVKVTQTTPEQTIVSTASAIDLAGSEDNRRTANGKERLIESAAINRSLFVLAQCVEAIARGKHRVPYRDSKMTRILALGQNHGLTVMILNLAPVRAYHLDTLSSLNFANRTKKIEVRDVENEPLARGPAKTALASKTGTGEPRTALRQPLRPLPSAANVGFNALSAAEKPVKSFPVFSERMPRSSLKRASGEGVGSVLRPSKVARTSSTAAALGRGSTVDARANAQERHSLTTSKIEALVTRLVDERLAALSSHPTTPALDSHAADAELTMRLNALESRLAGVEDETSVFASDPRRRSVVKSGRV